jgi:lipopolysaccharide/colanic/teichoic acid biosynthesis glycosyltransferase/glycosyltransferase involved in cell wall biosynthesis
VKILFVTQWFEPEPSFKGLLYIRELVARGNDVQVLTGFPNYPGGKVYPGYRIRPWMREQMEGIQILRVALYPSHNKSGHLRALNYLSFAFSTAVIGSLLIRKPDVMYVYHPPITVGFAASVIGFFRRTPFVIDVQDLWPDTVAASGMLSNSAVLSTLDKVCSFVYSRARHITVLSPGVKQALVNRGVPPDKIDVIYNWCDEKAMRPKGEPATRLGRADRFSILFAGVMGFAQDIDSVLSAAQICQTTTPEAEFLFMGAGVDRPRLERMAEGMRLENVKFLPPRPMHAMGDVFAGVDALVVHLKDDPLFRITIPSKTQAYLASGKPILMAVRGDAADLVKQSQSGVICEPSNPKSIAEAVNHLASAGPELLSRMGNNGRAFYDKELSISTGVEKFSRVFEAAVDREPIGRHRQVGLRFWVKSVFDRAVALCGLILLSPVFIGISLLIWLSMGRPFLFRQRRPGRFTKPFELLKFRTMSDRTDASGALLPDASRLTRVGRFLRATSIDELPQLWNVLCGQISLVGPRPLLMEYLPYYSQEQARRHDVLPGITGWAQINGRNELAWRDKFSRDVWYVENWTLRLDALILLRTVLCVLKREGIARRGHATMPFLKDIWTPHDPIQDHKASAKR